MARLESVAIGGYYKTPAHLISRIAPLLSRHVGQGQVTFMDPCAGEGEAILALLKILVETKNAHLYTCEMEDSRAKALKKACEQLSYHLSKNVLHGDAFRVSFKRDRREGVSVLYLNPPYDTDRVHGRLEHKFLIRFTPSLMDGGVLLFVVPFYALKASADYIATEYQNVHCFKFPDADFEGFKQVVLFAQKTETRSAPDARIRDQVLAYAANGASLPELPNIASAPLAAIPSSTSYSEGVDEWIMRPADMAALKAKARPWQQSTRGGAYAPIHGVLPDLPIGELMLRKYPVATPPRPAHIAAGIAAGIFNGARMEPNDPSLGLPPILVKGVFDQEYRTIEEKLSEDLEKVTRTQIQQPKLVTTVLDLRTRKYHTLGNAGTCDPHIERLTVAGLLQFYGNNLMRVMEEQCPIAYDPRKDGESIQLAATTRDPYTAQAHAAKAIIRLLGGPDLPLKERRGKAAYLLGEIGSGKSTVSLVIAKTLASKRPLIICPPHLLTSWTNEITAVLPEAKVQVLDSINSLEDVAADTKTELVVSVVSRETAKLSHGWEGVQDVCPKCGNLTGRPAEVLAKQRACCEARTLRVRGPLAQLVVKMCNQLMRFAPGDPTIQFYMTGRWAERRRQIFKDRLEKAPVTFPGFVASYFDEALVELLPRFAESDSIKRAIVWALLCTNDEERIIRTAMHFLGNVGYTEQEFGRQLLLMLPPNSPRQLEVIAAQRETTRSYYNPWANFSTTVEAAQKGDSWIKVGPLQVSWQGGVLRIGERAEPRSIEAATAALSALSHVAGLKWSPVCGEFLYQAAPSPRRIALAQHITKRYPTLFDFMIVDEAHEYGTEGSAQERAANRLKGLGIPFIEMTGSFMNGYAESVFMSLWSVSPSFRQEFKREDKQRFIDRYGYRKRLVTETYDGDMGTVEHGSMSDRVTRTERVIGNAPGILPLFLLKHLLPLASTLHKSDLALDLPPCIQERHLIDPGPVLLERITRLQERLIAQIKKDQFDKKFSGKLFGQLAELPSYLDRATSDTGNSDSGEYEIRYPESVGAGLVASQAPLAASTVLPKEQWMLDEVAKELAEGRNVMVFSWHVALLPRLARLIAEATGEKVPILYANKVPTAKRQDWITAQVVKKNARVMVTNPVAIQTGLNNLVHFSTEIWMENPACNPIIYRQATGRVDRIGQRLETRIKFAVYAGTLQEALYDLLLQKVAVSISTDGLDPESALLAAGVGADEFLTGLSIGKQLWAVLTEGVNTTRTEPVYKPGLKVSAPVSVFEMIDSIGE